MRVAALYDVHGMPWALEAVLAEVDADAIVFGGDYLYGPYPRETRRDSSGRSTRRACAATATDLRRTGTARSSRRSELEWLRRCRSRRRVDGVLYCHATPADDTADHDRHDARGRGRRRARSPGIDGHGRDRAHPPSVRPHGRRPAGRQRRLGRHGRTRARSRRSGRSSRTASRVRCARRSTSSARSREIARERLAAGGGVRRGEPAGRGRRATRRSRRSSRGDEGPDREGRPSARDRRRVLRRAAVGRRALVEDGRDASSPAARRSRSSPHRRSSGRPVIKLDRPVERGTRARGRARGAAADAARTSTTPSSSSGSRWWRRTGVSSEASRS